MGYLLPWEYVTRCQVVVSLGAIPVVGADMMRGSGTSSWWITLNGSSPST